MCVSCAWIIQPWVWAGLSWKSCVSWELPHSSSGKGEDEGAGLRGPHLSSGSIWLFKQNLAPWEIVGPIRKRVHYEGLGGIEFPATMGIWGSHLGVWRFIFITYDVNKNDIDSYTLLPLIFRTILCDRYYYYCHFPNEETEAQRSFPRSSSQTLRP